MSSCPPLKALLFWEVWQGIEKQVLLYGVVRLFPGLFWYILVSQTHQECG